MDFVTFHHVLANTSLIFHLINMYCRSVQCKLKDQNDVCRLHKHRDPQQSHFLKASHAEEFCVTINVHQTQQIPLDFPQFQVSIPVSPRRAFPHLSRKPQEKRPAIPVTTDFLRLLGKSQRVDKSPQKSVLDLGPRLDVGLNSVFHVWVQDKTRVSFNASLSVDWN